MKKLICLINLFIEEQNIYLADEELGATAIAATTTLEQLPITIVDIGNITGITHFELCGAKHYASELVPEILTYAKTRYNNNDITVEVK